MADCLDKQSQAAMSMVMMLPAGIIAAFDPDAKQEFDALLKKHGLDEQKMEQDQSNADSPLGSIERLSSSIGDTKAFLADLMTFMDSHADDNEQDGFTLGDGKLENLEIRGEKATGTVKTTDKSEPIEFVKVAGSWKIVLPLETLMGGGPEELSFSTEPDFGQGSRDPGDAFDWEYYEEDELPPPENVTLEDFESWKVSVSASEKPAREIIAEQIAACGMEFYNAGDVNEQLNKPVTLDLPDVSRLQVIEEACQQVGLYPRYKLRKIALAKGPRPYPIVFSGPFTIIANKIEEFVPYGAGMVELQIIASGLETNAISYLKELTISESENEGVLTHHVSSAAADDGSDLLSTRNSFGMSAVTKTTFLYEPKISLRNLLRDVESVAAIEGELSFEVPTKTESLKFEKLEEGTVLKSGEITLELKQISTTDDSSEFTLAFEGTEPGNIQLVAKSPEGKVLDSLGQSSFSMGSSGEISPSYEGKAATLEVSLILESERLRMPYALKKIPLASFSQQPETIEPLSFEGDVPVIATFVGMKEEDGQKKITVSLTNKSNKSIMSVSMNMDYLDASGKKLDDFPHSHSAGRDFLPPGETREVEIHAFFAPEGTKSAAFTVGQISFSDESEWNENQ